MAFKPLQTPLYEDPIRQTVLPLHSSKILHFICVLTYINRIVYEIETEDSNRVIPSYNHEISLHPSQPFWIQISMTHQYKPVFYADIKSG